MGLSFSPSTTRGIKWASACLLLAAACTLAPQTARAQQPQVSATFLQAGGFFNYNFTVRNLTAFTLADVNIATGASAISSLVAPTGFQITYDAGGLGPNQGVVDFTTIDGTRDFFAGSTVSGFQFRSSANLSGAAFNALDVQGNSYNGTIVTSNAAPEPGTLGLLAFATAPAAALVASRRRRSVCASASLKG